MKKNKAGGGLARTSGAGRGAPGGGGRVVTGGRGQAGRKPPAPARSLLVYSQFPKEPLEGVHQRRGVIYPSTRQNGLWLLGGKQTVDGQGDNGARVGSDRRRPRGKRGWAGLSRERRDAGHISEGQMSRSGRRQVSQDERTCRSGCAVRKTGLA